MSLEDVCTFAEYWEARKSAAVVAKKTVSEFKKFEGLWKRYEEESRVIKGVLT